MSKADSLERDEDTRPAEIVREYGPFHAGEEVAGVTHDGERVWFATGKKLRALDPVRGELTDELDVVCDAGTAFDGEFLYQLGDRRIQKVDPRTGQVVASLPTPGTGSASGLTWAEGKLWLAKYHERKIYQIDPQSGEVLKTVESNRYVTGVTWADGELWHATYEENRSELRRVEPDDGSVLTRLEMPAGTFVSGLEWDGRTCSTAVGGRPGSCARSGDRAHAEWSNQWSSLGRTNSACNAIFRTRWAHAV
jgi:glutamine cyclotransferase